MAHYAFLNSNNIVTEVITGIDETELIEGLHPEIWYGNYKSQVCKRTSYNARINGYRKNYAGIGYFFDQSLDAFIPPKPFNSWILNESICQWQAPKQYPQDGERYSWNESKLDWIKN
jgi:hypothetical protein